MKAHRSAATALLLLALCLPTEACGSASGSEGDRQPDPEPVAPRFEVPEYRPAEPVEETPGPVPRFWTCHYAPTADGDWHNDVVCSNGSEEHRPYLREWESFLTEEEIIAAAREYEAELNAGVVP